jgi:hypothetical protein
MRYRENGVPPDRTLDSPAENSESIRETRSVVLLSDPDRLPLAISPTYLPIQCSDSGHWQSPVATRG